jgi:predicted Zn finger-like uncharacterized protein
MPDMHIECPTCGWEGEVDDSHAGREVKCPKCKRPFTAESGDAYDLADGDPPPLSRAPAPLRAPTSGPIEPIAEGLGKSEEQPWKSWLDEWPQE